MLLAPIWFSPEPGMGIRNGDTCSRLLGLGLVSLQVQCNHQEAACPQDDGKDTAQKALLKAEEALQVGVGPPGPQGAGDLQRREVWSARSTRPASRPHHTQCLPHNLPTLHIRRHACSPAPHPALQVQ